METYIDDDLLEHEVPNTVDIPTGYVRCPGCGIWFPATWDQNEGYCSNECRSALRAVVERVADNLMLGETIESVQADIDDAMTDLAYDAEYND